MFLQPNSLEFDNHTIYPEYYYSSDHTLLSVDIFIIEGFVSNK